MFEYDKRIFLTPEPDDVIGFMDKLGEDRWETISIKEEIDDERTNHSFTTYYKFTLYLKRLIIEEI